MFDDNKDLVVNQLLEVSTEEEAALKSDLLKGYVEHGRPDTFFDEEILLQIRSDIAVSRRAEKAEGSEGPAAVPQAAPRRVALMR